MDARIAPPFMDGGKEATDASRLVCVVVVSYQEYSLTREPIVFVALAFVQGAPRSHRRRGMYTAVIPSDSRVFMAYYIGAQAKDGDYADYEPPTRC